MAAWWRRFIPAFNQKRSFSISIEVPIERVTDLEAENATLRAALVTAARLHVTDAHDLASLRATAAGDGQTGSDGWAALVSSQTETKIGLAHLLASNAALASSQAETKVALADLLASEAALGVSRAETKVGLENLLASAVELASSRTQTQAEQTSLMASAVALASSRAEAKVSLADLLASEVVNKALSLANDTLVQSEAAMREAEARFGFATRAAGLGVWELDLRTRELTATAMCKQNFGRDEASPFSYAELQDAVHPDDQNSFTADIARSIANGVDFDCECRVEHAGGAPGWVQVKARIAHAPDDAPLKLAGISFDITERVRSQERIRQSQQIEAVGRLTAGAAHDFNNVLQALLGGIELAMQRVTDDEVRADLELALQAGQRGVRLTSHLLSFSRQQTLLPAPLQLPQLLQELARTLTRTLGCDIAIDVAVAPDLPPIFADAAHLDSALLNLALNARDAMPHGGTLRIAASATDGQITIVVADSGEGMTPEVLTHACEPFFSTKGANGSGLGLAMVQGFVYQSGGVLRVQSTLGQGTQVEITLPVATVLPIAEPPRGIAPPRGHGRILVVDDEAGVSRVTATFLRQAGFKVATAADGAKALRVLDRGIQYDALITGLAMPGINGADLVRRVRALHPALPAMVITGSQAATAENALPSDVAVLCKPFSREDLIRQVQALIGGYGSDDAAAQTVLKPSPPPIARQYDRPTHAM